MEAQNPTYKETTEQEQQHAVQTFETVLGSMLAATSTEEREHYAGVLKAMFIINRGTIKNLKRYKHNAKKSMKALQTAYEGKLRLLAQARGEVKLDSTDTLRQMRYGGAA